MSTRYIARAYSAATKQWYAFLEVPTVAEAANHARTLMDLIAYDAKGDSRPPWTLIEVASTDAHTPLIRQWVAIDTGYHAVRGRGVQ